MKKSFIKMNRGRETLELMKDRNAFILLAQIASRAKRTNGYTYLNLAKGEALIGDHKHIGITRGQYREATKRLIKHGFITIRTTNKGTIAKLINSDVFDINEEPEQPSGPPSNNHPTTTNNNVKKEKKKNSCDSECPYQCSVDLFNQVLPDLPSVKLITKERKKVIKARWMTSDRTQTLDWWRGFFAHINRSDFLMGRTVKFRASFDWILRKSNFVKILEGNYD